MIRGTTPAFEFNLPFEASMLTEIRVTFAQNGRIRLTKTQDDVTYNAKVIVCSLSQKDSLQFSPNGGEVTIELKVKTTGGSVLISTHKVPCANCICEEVL